MTRLAPGITLRNLDDAALALRLRDAGVQLRLEEARRLCATLDRDPTRAELFLFNSMWSEHCSYKSTRQLLKRLPTEAPNVVLGPGADAGVVRLPRVGSDGRARLENAGPGAPGRCVVLGHESHNHPSQLLPVEGAATGIGGIVRDVYCMGADVVGVLDVLRFGDPQGPQADAVRQIARGVVRGIAAYGNALGVPNLGGDVEFEADFDDNCLVNVVALGLMDENDLVPSVAPAVAAAEAYVLLLVGKPTDDSGLGGAAFASGVLDTGEDTQQRGAVQLPDPFFKRVLTEANKHALAFLRAHGAPFAVKDLGAAGLGGAASEMAAGAGFGLDLDLDVLHRVRADEAAHVLVVSETQERYAFAVPQAAVEPLIAIYEKEFELGALVRGAGARAVGRFTPTRRFRVFQGGLCHVDVPSELITEAPRIDWPQERRAPAPVGRVAPRPAPRDVLGDLRALLGSTGGASRHWLFQRYDCEVQGRTLLRPGDADAGAIVARDGEPVGIAMGLGGTARTARRGAWRAAAAAVCEAVRNVVAVGATPWALTDCLNYGSPETPNGMQDLADGVDGLSAAATGIGLRGFPGAPLAFVSGNVSLYNASLAGRAIPPSPLVACLGVWCDFSRAHGVRLQAAGNLVLWAGEDDRALGGSLWARVMAETALFDSDPLPRLDLDGERARMHAVLDASDAGLVQSCHDTGDGGIVMALAEMTFARRGEATLGVRFDFGADETAVVAWSFAESPGYLCEVRPADRAAFEAACARHGVGAHVVGIVVADPVLERAAAGAPRERVACADLAAVWRGGLRRVFDEGSDT
jgi:phosphoribosylformylglycinamidine synthase II